MKAPDNTKDHYAPILGMDLEKVVGAMPFWLGSMMKYLWRAPRKGKYADLNKAIDCARRALDIEMPKGHSPLEAPQEMIDFYVVLGKAIEGLSTKDGWVHVQALKFAHKVLNHWFQINYHEDFISVDNLHRSASRVARGFETWVRLLPELIRQEEVTSPDIDLWKDLRD